MPFSPPPRCAITLTDFFHSLRPRRAFFLSHCALHRSVLPPPALLVGPRFSVLPRLSLVPFFQSSPPSTRLGWPPSGCGLSCLVLAPPASLHAALRAPRAGTPVSYLTHPTVPVLSPRLRFRFGNGRGASPASYGLSAGDTIAMSSSNSAAHCGYVAVATGCARAPNGSLVSPSHRAAGCAGRSSRRACELLCISARLGHSLMLAAGVRPDAWLRWRCRSSPAHSPSPLASCPTSAESQPAHCFRVPDVLRLARSAPFLRARTPGRPECRPPIAPPLPSPLVRSV